MPCASLHRWRDGLRAPRALTAPPSSSHPAPLTTTPFEPSVLPPRLSQFNLAVVLTNQVCADPGAMAAYCTATPTCATLSPVPSPPLPGLARTARSAAPGRSSHVAGLCQTLRRRWAGTCSRTRRTRAFRCARVRATRASARSPTRHGAPSRRRCTRSPRAASTTWSSERAKGLGTLSLPLGARHTPTAAAQLAPHCA